MAKLSAAERMTKARVAMLIRKPFYGRLACRLKLVDSTQLPPNCAGTATDGTHLFYRRESIEAMTDADIQWCIEHEVLHIVQNTFDRKPRAAHPGHWNIACDCWINVSIEESGSVDSEFGKKLTPGWMKKLVKSGSGEGLQAYLTSEQIYYKLLEKQPECKACKAGVPFPKPGEQQGQQGQQGNDPGDGQEGSGGDESGGQGQLQDGQGNSSGNNQQPEHTCCGDKGCISGSSVAEEITEGQRAAWKQHMIAAAQAAKSKGNLPGFLEEMIGKLLEPTVNWKDILRMSATRAFRGRYTWRSRSRRQGTLPLRMIAREPTKKGAVIMLDTSGSISDNELVQFVSEAADIMKTCGAPWIDVYLHDTVCYKVWRLNKSELASDWEVRRGGTSHIDVFKKCLEAEEKPGMIVAFTDLYTDFPPESPPCPVIWGYPTDQHPEECTIQVPFGTKIPVDLSEEG